MTLHYRAAIAPTACGLEKDRNGDGDGQNDWVSIFDGHNDLLSCLFHEADPDAASFLAGRNGDIDLSRCRTGGFAGGFFAVWAGNDPATAPDPMAVFREFAAIDAARARTEKTAQISTLLGLCQTHPDAIRLCTSASAIKAARNVDAIAAILHIEGCEAIGPDLEELHVFHAQGLRSLGPVWSRPNIFGAGVPFNFPASPDTGPGLTDTGARLIAACNALGVLVDLSHLNEAGFGDVARGSDQPLVATQSNAHAVTPCTGNLTDRQLDAMAERGGLAGLNFGCQFLRPDGVKNPETQPLDLIRNLDHLIGRLGEKGVALGSDFDRAMMPEFIGDASGLPHLIAAMHAAGYGDTLIRRLCRDNWPDLLRRVIG